jgi:hypothetical protein
MGEAAKWSGRVIRGEHLPSDATTKHGLPEKLSEPLREHLRTARLERADLYADTETSKNITFYDLRGTGVTWEALAGTEPMRIMQRAGHVQFATTLGYIREAETVGRDVGTPFPPLPSDLGGPDQGSSAPGGDEPSELLDTELLASAAEAFERITDARAVTAEAEVASAEYPAGVVLDALPSWHRPMRKTAREKPPRRAAHSRIASFGCGGWI